MSNFRWGGAAFSGRCACSRHRECLTEGLSGEEVPKINFISTNFAYLQFQTGLQSKLLFLHHPHSACEPYPAHCRLMPSVSFNCFFPTSPTPGPHQLHLGSRPPSSPLLLHPPSHNLVGLSCKSCLASL